jgi:tetratricopeptide (TPR) repeat protein
MNPQNENEILGKLKQAEEKIETALWQAVKDSNHEVELQRYQEVKDYLLSLSGLLSGLTQERDRILSYCLMRIDNALVELGDSVDAVSRAREAFNFAKRSGNAVQLARCALAYGTRLLNVDDLSAAESEFKLVYELAEKYPNDKDIQQTLGWALIVRGHILNRKSLYTQALTVLKEAEEICLSIDNYAGLAQVNALLTQVYGNLNEAVRVEECEKKAKEYQKKAILEKL